MSTKVKAVKKCPTFTKEIIAFDKKGNKVIKTVEVSDHFLVIMNNGSSIAVSAKDLGQYGIAGVVTDDKSQKIVEVSKETVDNDDDDDDSDEETETETETETKTENVNPGLISGSIK